MMVIVNDVYIMENEAYDKAEKLVKDMIPRVVTHGLPFNHQNIFEQARSYLLFNSITFSLVAPRVK
ncbi:hypothetical protein N7533_002384 [Penicillium manginii]|uniref:uncharacterized protein n=1 Tax=Penicillium manginii TaxID=203109 RepID=UPI002547E46F|nr:uncharacterized protein N7533_002384 [Penicillium manginii]KAJ5763703.1 hypothetical protein N7533_002384 [Penicillium manginii]